jgi:predicted secreted protein
MFRRIVWVTLFTLAFLEASNFRETHPQAFSATNINDAVIALYGKEKFSAIKESSLIKLTTPSGLVKDPQEVPIEIKSIIPSKSVSVMFDKHDRALIAVFDQKGKKSIDLVLTIQMEIKATLFVVIEALDGKLYYARAFIDVVCLPCMAN